MYLYLGTDLIYFQEKEAFLSKFINKTHRLCPLLLAKLAKWHNDVADYWFNQLYCSIAKSTLGRRRIYVL